MSLSNERFAEVKNTVKQYATDRQEQHRTALLTACAFAKVFLDSADHELRGGTPDGRVEAAQQLQAALRNIEPEVEV